MADGGFQFFREEGFAIVRGQGRPSTGAGKQARGRRPEGRRSARDIIGEAIRAEGDAPHVRAPKPPRVLQGVPAEDLLVWYLQLEDLAKRHVVKTKIGERRQRSDTPILLGAIASYPGPADDDDPSYVEWRAKTAAFLRHRYGDRVVSIIEHRDEPHGHLHGLVADAGKSVKPLMAGHCARLKAEAAGLSKKEASAAYKSATRELQDAYYASVSVEVGLTRMGPGRRSLSRSAWNAEKAQARAIAAGLRRKYEQDAEIAAQLEQIRAAAIKLQKRHQQLEQQRLALCQMAEALTPMEEGEAARRLDDIKRRDATAAQESARPATAAIPRSGPVTR